MYYKMYASHYEVTTYEYTYPRVHADAISYSSYEADSPVYITTSSRPRLINKHAKMGVVHASYTKVPKPIDSRDLLWDFVSIWMSRWLSNVFGKF